MNELNNYKKELAEHKINGDKLRSQVNLFEKSIDIFDVRLARNEQYVNRESLIISGIPSNVSQRNLEETVLNILHNIGLENLSSYEIAVCHRLKKKEDDPYPARTIVRFTNRKIVYYCLKNRSKLSNLKRSLKMNLRFYESLCSSNQTVLRMCTELKNKNIIKEYFISNGFVKIIRSVQDHPIKINNPNMLRVLFAGHYNSEDLQTT